MDERLEDFAGLLRQNGLRVSPAEVTDAAQALLLVGMVDRGAFRGALRATLVKRGQDAAVFDRLFELYFTGAKDLVDGLQGSLIDALEAEQLGEQELEEVARMLAQMSPLSQAQKELQQLLQMLQERGLDPAVLELATRRVSETLKGLEEAARRAVDREQKARDSESRGE